MTEIKTEPKSSVTIGSAAKDFMVKCYIDFETMDDEKVKSMIRKTVGAFKYGKELSNR